MKTCPRCKELNGENATQCYNCGYALKDVRYICNLCNEDLDNPTSKCTCGGYATSVRDNPIIPFAPKTNQLDIIFNKKHIKLKILILIVFLIGVFGYIKIYTIGVKNFEEVRLTAKKMPDGKLYKGKHLLGKINIRIHGQKNVDSIVTVTFDLPNNNHFTYAMEFSNPQNWIGSKIIIYKNGTYVGEGTYEDEYGVFIHKNNTIVDEFFNSTIIIMDPKPFPANYEVPLTSLCRIVLDKDTSRGNPLYLFFAIYLSIITLIDFLFPLFFFKLKNFLHVRDPEPSDLYETIQEITWYVVPFIVLGLLIASLFI